MSRQARQQSNTGVYHVIQRGVNRMLIFHEDADRRMFLDLLKSQAGEFFKVYCFCLMDQSAFNCSLQSRSPLASPKIRDSAVPICVAIGILYWSQVRIIL